MVIPPHFIKPVLLSRKKLHGYDKYCKLLKLHYKEQRFLSPKIVGQNMKLSGYGLKSVLKTHKRPQLLICVRRGSHYKVENCPATPVTGPNLWIDALQAACKVMK
ncbi:hypothetical protein KUTeg_023531 [Tegillarca granosa]|uniref:Uncharacterized protein n=1 Tax=Tegillarca granosa TaxID=220873 RepID=A0ABQ9E6U3_TEGGR|nr:hypothetical protein KUTeg_023531 [Tegillarca granosa]